MTTTTLVIEPDFFGFPDVGHGGYMAGLIAEQAPGPLEVKFVRPAPLGVSLALTDSDAGLTLALDGTTIAEARRVEFDPEVPPAPTPEEAQIGRSTSLAATSRPSWSCMTCGPGRAPGEGLRVFVGPVQDRDLVAGDWVAHPAFADDDGFLMPRFVWAALDCPTYWAIFSGVGPPGRAVTARLSAAQLEPVPAEQPLIVIGWPLASRRSLLRGGAALLTADGRPLAVAEATWMQPNPAPEAGA